MAEPYIGQVIMTGFTFAPLGWAQCNGQSMPISQYDTLYTLIGTTFGGDGVNTFNLPNLMSRVTVGAGKGPQTSNYVLGQSSGTETVTITTTSMPAHSHIMECIQGNANQTTPVNNTWATEPSGALAFYADATDGTTMSPLAITTAGGSQPHENLMPGLCVNFCIALQGIWPSQP